MSMEDGKGGCGAQNKDKTVQLEAKEAAKLAMVII